MSDKPIPDDAIEKPLSAEKVDGLMVSLTPEAMIRHARQGQRRIDYSTISALCRPGWDVDRADVRDLADGEGDVDKGE